jgi:hypothetical protein
VLQHAGLADACVASYFDIAAAIQRVMNERNALVPGQHDAPFPLIWPNMCYIRFVAAATVRARTAPVLERIAVGIVAAVLPH